MNWYPYDNSSREDATGVFLYPDDLRSFQGHVITIIPSLTKLFGDYKFIYDDKVYWVFKEFLEPIIELFEEIKIDF